MKKRLLSILLITAIVFSITACKTSSEPEPKEDIEKTLETDTSTALNDSDKTENQTPDDSSIPEPTEEIENPSENTNSDSTTESNETTPPTPDMTGDYIGKIPCPLPPKNDSYILYHNDVFNECLVLYIENIDDANFEFSLFKAVRNKDKHKEYLLFKKHTAHYNGNGYYEYIGKDYHLYFKYTEEGQGSPYPWQIVSTLSVYGLEKLFNPNHYQDTIQYKGIVGNVFYRNLPFAG